MGIKLRFRIKPVIMVILLICMLLIGGFFTGWVPHRSTSEEAVSAYLNWITTKCEIKSIKQEWLGDGTGTAKYVVVSTDIYNFRANNAKSDGKNSHYLYVKQSSLGWYVIEDDSAP